MSEEKQNTNSNHDSKTKPEHVHHSGMDIEYLTVLIDKLKSDKNYPDKFMAEIKKRICCDDATLPFLIIRYNNKIEIFVDGGEKGLSLAQIKYQLHAYKQLTNGRVLSAERNRKS